MGVALSVSTSFFIRCGEGAPFVRPTKNHQILTTLAHESGIFIQNSETSFGGLAGAVLRFRRSWVRLRNTRTRGTQPLRDAGEHPIAPLCRLVDFPLKQLGKHMVLSGARGGKTVLRMSDFAVERLQFHPLERVHHYQALYGFGSGRRPSRDPRAMSTTIKTLPLPVIAEQCRATSIYVQSVTVFLLLLNSGISPKNWQGSAG